jgi:hypothetical protein
MRALAIRDDTSSEELRRQARRVHDGRVSARLLAIANALDGMDRTTAARLAGMDRQILRDWVRRYNAAGIAGLFNRKAPGRQPKLTLGVPRTRGARQWLDGVHLHIRIFWHERYDKAWIASGSGRSIDLASSRVRPGVSTPTGAMRSSSLSGLARRGHSG